MCQREKMVMEAGEQRLRLWLVHPAEWMMVCRDCGIEYRCDTMFCSNKRGRLMPPVSVSVLFFLSAPQSKNSLPRNSQQLNSLQTCFHLQAVVLVDLVTLSSEPLLTSDSLLCLFEFFLYWVEIIFCPRMQPWTGTGESHPPLLATISVLMGSLSLLRYWKLHIFTIQTE